MGFQGGPFAGPHHSVGFLCGGDQGFLSRAVGIGLAEGDAPGLPAAHRKGQGIPHGKGDTPFDGQMGGYQHLSVVLRQPAGEQADRERIPGSGRQTGEKEIRLFGALDPLQGGIPQVFQHGGVGNLRVLGLGLDKGGVHGIEGDVPIPVLILGTDDQEVEQRGPEGGHNGHQGGG